MYIQKIRGFFGNTMGGSLQSKFVLGGQHKVKKPSTPSRVVLPTLISLCKRLFVSSISFYPQHSRDTKC